MKITWILEEIIFTDQNKRLADAAKEAGHSVIYWNEDWLNTETPPILSDSFVVFQGSLGCAAKVKEFGWFPGAYCNVDRFRCSSWYKAASAWLVHSEWSQSTVQSLADNPKGALNNLKIRDQFFVRPDSPLKPFSGRVLSIDGVSLAALDHGFYYDDSNLDVIIAPIRNIGREWRFVIAGSDIVTFSAYEADGRTESFEVVPKAAVDLATQIASQLDPPDDIYVMDICESGSKMKLMELNPFSGADLYACDRSAIVGAIERIARSQPSASVNADKPRRLS